MRLKTRGCTHNSSVIQKADECRAELQHTTAEILKLYKEKEEGLAAELTNKKNELVSEKGHKELLVKKMTQLRTEMDSLKSNSERSESTLREEITTKDQEIAWLKKTMQQREEEHRQAISPRKDLINKLQPTTPSSQHGATPTNTSHRYVTADTIVRKST